MSEKSPDQRLKLRDVGQMGRCSAWGAQEPQRRGRRVLGHWRGLAAGAGGPPPSSSPLPSVHRAKSPVPDSSEAGM